MKSKQITPTELLDGKLSHCIDKSPCHTLLLDAQSEAWFSNQLAWLLDPKGSHGLGVTFLELFLKQIGQWRSTQETKHKATQLKSGKKGPGVGSTHLRLANCSIFREFFLSRIKSKTKTNSPLFCDLAVVDLDTSDGLFLVIENKLFTTDHPTQLDDYEECVKEKFKPVKILEFVYLTLRGDKGKYANKGDNWANLSWLTDIKKLLKESLEQRKSKAPPAVRVGELLTLLEWMDDLSGLIDLRQDILKSFTNWLRITSGKLLLEELIRLNEGKVGTWQWSERKHASFLLGHSSFPSIGLQISLATGMVVTAQLQRFGAKNKPINEKILIPLGAHPDQVINLIDIAARDIYHSLPGKPGNYLANKRRLKNHIIADDIAKELKVTYQHRYELPILLKLYAVT